MDFLLFFFVMNNNKNQNQNKDTYIIDDFVEGIGKVLKKQILQIDLHAKNPV